MQQIVEGGVNCEPSAVIVTKSTKRHEKEHLNHRGHGDTEKKEEHGDLAYSSCRKPAKQIRQMRFWKKDKSQKVTKKYFP